MKGIYYNRESKIVHICTHIKFAISGAFAETAISWTPSVSLISTKYRTCKIFRSRGAQETIVTYKKNKVVKGNRVNVFSCL